MKRLIITFRKRQKKCPFCYIDMEIQHKENEFVSKFSHVKKKDIYEESRTQYTLFLC